MQLMFRFLVEGFKNIFESKISLKSKFVIPQSMPKRNILFIIQFCRNKTCHSFTNLSLTQTKVCNIYFKHAHS